MQLVSSRIWSRIAVTITPRAPPYVDIPLFERLSIFAKELTVTIRVMQSSSKELSSTVGISINVNKGKINAYTFKFAYAEAADGCKGCYQAQLKLVRFRSQLEISRLSRYTQMLWYSLSVNDNIYAYLYLYIRIYVYIYIYLTQYIYMYI